MNPKKRKKEPPDPSFPLYGSLCGDCFPSTLAISLIYSESSSLCPSYPCLNLSHCRVNLPLSGLLCLPSPELNLLVLDGPRSSASVGSCTWPHLLLGSVSFVSLIRTNCLCIDLGGSLQLTRGCLWAHQLALIVAGAASPVGPVCVFDLPCIAQSVVEEGCFRAVHIRREELCRSSSNCGSSLAFAAQDLGILREGLLPVTAIVDPSSRFVLGFNFDVFQPSTEPQRMRSYD